MAPPHDNDTTATDEKSSTASPNSGATPDWTWGGLSTAPPPGMIHLKLPPGVGPGSMFGYRLHRASEMTFVWLPEWWEGSVWTVAADPLPQPHDVSISNIPMPQAKTLDRILDGFPLVKPKVGKRFEEYPTVVFRVPAPPDGSAETLEEPPMASCEMVEAFGVPLPASYAACARGCTYEVRFRSAPAQ